MIRLLTKLLAVTLVLGLGACGKPADPPAQTTQSPESVTVGFYEVYLKQRMSGLPNDSQLAQLRPYLSQALIDAIGAARQEQAREISAHPDEKPPWIEGDLFSSLFEGATACRIGKPKVTGDEARMLVRLSRQDKDQPLVEWADRLVLKKENGRWAIADIEYGGDWPFANHGSLKQTLTFTH